MSDESLIHSGDTPDAQGEVAIRRRSQDEAEREIAVNRQQEPPQDPTPGGAEGGEESHSRDWLVDHPQDTDPLGDTDQHSDPENLPTQRERHNRRRV